MSGETSVPKLDDVSCNPVYKGGQWLPVADQSEEQAVNYVQRLEAYCNWSENKLIECSNLIYRYKRIMKEQKDELRQYGAPVDMRGKGDV